MKVTYNWLKDFVEIRISAQELAQKLTMAGFEVTALEQRVGILFLNLRLLLIVQIAFRLLVLPGRLPQLPVKR